MTVSGEGRRGLILPDDLATVRAFTPWNGMTERTVDRRFASFTQALLAGALAALACLAPAAAQSPAPDHADRGRTSHHRAVRARVAIGRRRHRHHRRRRSSE